MNGVRKRVSRSIQSDVVKVVTLNSKPCALTKTMRIEKKRAH